jgi:hypothetical protein
MNVAQSVYAGMDSRQRRAFIRLLPEALTAFAAHDFSAWKMILDLSGIENAQKIVDDTIEDTKGANLVRDYSGLQRLAEQLGIIDDLEFEFKVMT